MYLYLYIFAREKGDKELLTDWNHSGVMLAWYGGEKQFETRIVNDWAQVQGGQIAIRIGVVVMRFHQIEPVNGRWFEWIAGFRWECEALGVNIYLFFTIDICWRRWVLGGGGCFLYVVERCSRRMDIGILLEGWSDCHLSGRYTAEHESRNLCSFVWHWGRDVEFGIFYAILFIMILTSEPRVHTAIIALHGTAGLFRFAQTCPPWRDIDSRAALCPWHPYKMMCCRKSRLRTESNIGSY